MKAKIEELRKRFIDAKTEAERDAIRDEMRHYCDMDASAVADAALESIRATNATLRDSVLRKKLENILPAVSVSYIANKYFQRTPQWFYQRLNGNIVNGKSASFTADEKKRLHDSLIEISNNLNAAASIVC